MVKPGLVFFDLGDVVCRFTPAERLKAFAKQTGLAEDELDACIWKSGYSSACDRGDHTLEQMISGINKRTEQNLTQTTLVDIWRRAFILNENVYNIAQQVSAHARVGMFTNNAPLLRCAFPVWFQELETLFDPIVFSYELTATKPDKEAFQRAQKMVGLSAEELMLIDDSKQNVETAATLGWQAIHFVDASQLAFELGNRGLL